MIHSAEVVKCFSKKCLKILTRKNFFARYDEYFFRRPQINVIPSVLITIDSVEFSIYYFENFGSFFDYLWEKMTKSLLKISGEKMNLDLQNK